MSFREQIQVERMLTSSLRCRYRSPRHVRFATRARSPVPEMSSAFGGAAERIFAITWTNTATPNPSMIHPLSCAARALELSDPPTTIRLNP
jgi:hypothetical protein